VTAKILQLMVPCDRCTESTFIGDMEAWSSGRRWCSDCCKEHAAWEYRSEPEINPDR
jgi:hypothetical protein